MLELAVFLALSCPTTQMVNKSALPWNDYDLKTLESIKRNGTCSAHFPGNPCVGRFFKLGFQSYYAECGVERK
jgi:hypothetical protein